MIHKLAIIDPKAKIAENVHVGPWTLIGPDVEIGEGSWIGSHVVVQGPTKIGKENKIFQFASIGAAPQDKKYQGEPTQLIVGDRNIFRECSTVHRGTANGKGFTFIGNDNLFMAYTHVAHDCVIGNHVTFSNNASIAGHVTVEDHASLGGMVGVHQFCLIGKYSFCAGGSGVVKDVPPYIMVSGHPAAAYGLNSVGLERQGFQTPLLAALKRAYKVIYRESVTVQDAIQELKTMVADTPEIQNFIDFLGKSVRGITR